VERLDAGTVHHTEENNVALFYLSFLDLKHFDKGIYGPLEEG
jgi:hypothetical protein